MTVALTNNNELTEIRILKEATCLSLSERSTLTYQIGCNETNDILFRIHGNSGTGKFNREWVPSGDMLELIYETEKPFSWKVLQGHTVLFTTAANMLSDLAAQDGDNALRRRLQHYSKPALLIIDEIGYLSYSNRHADLLFEIINRRYEHHSTVVTTNRPFGEWAEICPNASCVVSLIDRLVHHSQIVAIEGNSYRMKEAKEQATKRKRDATKKRASK